MTLASALSLVGALLASYLTWVHYNAGALVCGVGDCHTVQASEFAAVGPVPVAALGLGMYLTVLLGNLAARGRPDLAVATTIAFAAALGGTLYAAYLTWLEVAVIGAICQWCVTSALLTVAIAILEGCAVWRVLETPIDGDDETGVADAASLTGEPQGRGTAGPRQRLIARGKIST